MIVAECPQCADEGKYSVMSASRLLGIHRATLERYRQLNLIKASLSMATNRKYYLGADIKKLWRKL